LGTEINNININVQIITIGVERDVIEYPLNVDCEQALAAARVPHLDCAVLTVEIFAIVKWLADKENTRHAHGGSLHCRVPVRAERQRILSPRTTLLDSTSTGLLAS
jgi:hypothetical protein